MPDRVNGGAPQNSAAFVLPPKVGLIAGKPGSLSGDNTKIEKSAKEFESILLGSWLQQAEQSFAKLPGGDDDEDADAGKEQFQGMAMQSLGTAMTASGGIGLARMVSANLHKAQKAEELAISEKR